MCTMWPESHEASQRAVAANSMQALSGGRLWCQEKKAGHTEYPVFAWDFGFCHLPQFSQTFCEVSIIDPSLQVKEMRLIEIQ